MPTPSQSSGGAGACGQKNRRRRAACQHGARRKIRQRRHQRRLGLRRANGLCVKCLIALHSRRSSRDRSARLSHQQQKSVAPRFPCCSRRSARKVSSLDRVGCAISAVCIVSVAHTRHLARCASRGAPETRGALVRREDGSVAFSSCCARHSPRLFLERAGRAVYVVAIAGVCPAHHPPCPSRDVRGAFERCEDDGVAPFPLLRCRSPRLFLSSGPTAPSVSPTLHTPDASLSVFLRGASRRS